MSKDTFENIGKVKLDLEFYKGDDLYCDGDVEDQLLESVKSIGGGDYKSVIESQNNWPFLYHLSPLRGNIISWFPFDNKLKVLEIGAGCGAITSCIADRVGELTCVDLSKKRCMINAYRNQDKDNITIKVGNFQDIEPSLDTDYDLILLIGVFEYAAAYINDADPYVSFLNIIKKHVKESGNIVIAIENRLGLKYFAGCREDHLGQYYKGIENYPDGGVVRTFSRPKLEKLLNKADIKEFSFYYPYPDYKFTDVLYSDDRLPIKGELTTNLRNFDRDRMLLFDEKMAFDSIIEDGEFPLFSNSYVVVTGKKPDVIYSKFSNDRDDKYAIRTDIVNCNGEIKAVKTPIGEAAANHIDSIKRAYELLTKRYDNGQLLICPLDCKDNAISFKYIDGITLEEKLDGLLDDEEAFTNLVKDYYERISYNDNANVTDYDLIFSNIIIDKNNNWNVIDYEWTYEKNIPSEEILERAVFCYKLGASNRVKIDGRKLLEKVTGRDDLYHEEKLYQDEINFQKSVTGGHKSLSEMRDSIHHEVLPLVNAIMRHEAMEREKLVQIYMDNGEGYKEEESLFIMPEQVNDADNSENLIRIKLSENTIKLRFDPKMKPCMVGVVRGYLEKKDGTRFEYPVYHIQHNGTLMPGEVFGFIHNDANIYFNMKHFKKVKPEDGDTFVITYTNID